MEFKYFVVGMLALILVSLGRALYYLSSSKTDDGGKMVKALAWRIGLSMALFLLLILAYYQGWIEPQHLH
jgi:formate/nitrite transporter FocA (FNT family)